MSDVDDQTPCTCLGQYAKEAYAFARYPDRGVNLAYAALGLAGEAGEFADKVKKVIRDYGGQPCLLRRAMIRELGDVLWYVNACAIELDTDLVEVAQRNLEKLEGRAERGTIQGSGDER